MHVLSSDCEALPTSSSKLNLELTALTRTLIIEFTLRAVR